MDSPTRTANKLIEMKRRTREAAAVLGHDLGRFSSKRPLFHQAACRHCGLLGLVYRELGGYWEQLGPALTTPCDGR